MKNNLISIVKGDFLEYPNDFNPNIKFPELINLSYNLVLNKENKIYSLVRELLYNLNLDRNNFNTDKWNPFKDLVKENDNVVIKPNLVLDKHFLGQEGVDSMITHASIIRPIIDYLLIATKGNVKITICDVPLQSCDWEELIKKNGLKDLINFYKNNNIDIELLDLRYEIAYMDKNGVYIQKEKKERDPKGYIAVDLGKNSYLYEIKKDSKKLEITDYGKGTVAKHHNNNKNEYKIPKTILDADLFINIPKLKTHKKAGVTLTMKNLIGINGDKSWIAHHRRGVDEYKKFNFMNYLKWNVYSYSKIISPKFTSFLIDIYSLFSNKIKKSHDKNLKKNHNSYMDMEGNWYGNDTLWRTILDLNKIILYSDKNGIIKEEKQRNYFAIIDGIIGMDYEGPMNGYPQKSGVLLGGFNPVAMDIKASEIMGFDYKKIKQINKAIKDKKLIDFKVEEIIVKKNYKKDINLKYEPSLGWKNYIELK